MLREIGHTQQRANEPLRRWFTNNEFDLYVWQDRASQCIVAFQLCYDKSDDERVLYWDERKGYMHAGIDKERGLGPATPTFRATGDGFDPGATLTRLKVVRGNMDSVVFDFVHDKLLAYGQGLNIPLENWTEFTRR